MIRAIKRKTTRNGDKIAILECDHWVVLPVSANRIMVQNKIMTLYCEECGKAMNLPNTVKEIYEIYWRFNRGIMNSWDR